ncbi:MAG: DUF389 domain-containing protein, partial [Anaerolineae bacterium]|nr:DUF389 domain-containing protein [Anaerolineae bacterium]
QLAASATLRGMLLAIGMGVLAGLVFANVEPTPEILGRTAPSLLDLGIALVSGLAAAYALCRKDVSSSLPGVAIAAALVPPLVTVGIGLSRLNMEIAGGALLLFLTNLIAISAAGGLVFFILGFRPRLSKQGRSGVFTGGIASSLVLLALMVWVLGGLTVNAFTEAALERRIDHTLKAEIANMDEVTLDRWEKLETNDDTLKLDIQVKSPRSISHQSVVDLQNRVVNALQIDQPVALVMNRIPSTTLDPINPPTLTPTPTEGPSPTPTSTRTYTPTPTKIPTLEPTVVPATATPVPTSTSTPSPSPTDTATPTPSYTPVPVAAVIANTSGQGVKLRWTPGGPQAGAFSEGTVVQILYEREFVNEIEWVKVIGPEERIGWVARDYLVEIR